MTQRAEYRAQVELLIRCLPIIARVGEFALKGGTAINLFVRDMPRLSVDIDLTYLPVTRRAEALTDIRSKLSEIGEDLRRAVPGLRVQLTDAAAPKLLARTAQALVKIEPNVVIRGSILPPVMGELCPSAQRQYELFAEIQRLHTAEIYGGKLCAALDRQHPRDLFDVKLLLAGGPIPDLTRQAFVAYLAGHRRPIAELLAPTRKPIDDLFVNHFSGMTEQPVELAELDGARTQLFEWTSRDLSESERRFLLSVKRGEPDWSLLPFEGLDAWPPIQWKLLNIRKMSRPAHEAALNRLRDLIEM